MNTPSRGAASLIGALALAFAVQVPALADSYTHVDARHDVEKSPQEVRAPHYRQTDVKRVKIIHGDKSIPFTIRLRSSSLKNLKFRSVGFSLKTPDHMFDGGWIASPGAAQYLLSDETGNDVSCSESSGRNGRTIWLKLDRACFGNPRWIRSSVFVGANNGTLAWGDNALSDNWRHTYDATLSPRIHAPKSALGGLRRT